MNKKNGILLTATIAGIGCVVAGVAIQRAGQSPPSVQGITILPDTRRPAAPINVPETPRASKPQPPEPEPAPAPAIIHPNEPKRPSTKPAKRFADAEIPNRESAPIQQIARIALSFVGVDGDAEDVWIAAINDPTLPADDRKNLIEDLNEDGFADPDHPTADELPLILNRLDLIESLVPDAIDDVNYAAFAEAYTDLLNMYHKLTQ